MIKKFIELFKEKLKAHSGTKFQFYLCFDNENLFHFFFLLDFS